MYSEWILSLSHRLSDNLQGKCNHISLSYSLILLKASDVRFYFQVSFIGEDGMDGGGLTREFFTLLIKDLSRIYLEVTGIFRHDALALQVRISIDCDKL